MNGDMRGNDKSMAKWLLVPAFASLVTLAACSAVFPSGDIKTMVQDKTATWPISGATSYSVYAGYTSSCAHPGVHINFGAIGVVQNVLAVANGVVAKVEKCVNAGENDKYTFTIALGLHGSVPVYIEYSLEPYGGRVCTGPNQPSSYFHENIFISSGQTVSQGEAIARFLPLGSGAHIHVNLRADNAHVCPDIFPSSVFSDTTLITSGPSPNTCGSEIITNGTLCHQLTSSEDPAQVFR